MANLKNCVTLLGRIAKDITLSQGENAVARTSIAVQRNFKNKDGNYDADFIPIVAFGKQAEFLDAHFTKGDVLYVQGNIRTGSYTNKDGQKVYTTDVFVDQIDFVPGSKKDGEEKTEKKSNSKSKVDPDEDFMNISQEDLDEMPW